jgi:NADH:ubiquinone oxidoreductase subunit 3 (subunit A)
MIGAGAALTAVTSGAILPLFVALGVATGAVQAASFAYKAVTAKDGDALEQAFYEAGAPPAALAYL